MKRRLFLVICCLCLVIFQCSSAFALVSQEMLSNEAFFACREGHIAFSMPLCPDYIMPEADLNIEDGFIPDGAKTPYAWKNNTQYLLYTDTEEIFYHTADLTAWVEAMRAHEFYADRSMDELRLEAAVNYAMFYMNIFGGAVDSEFDTNLLVSKDGSVSLLTTEFLYHYDDTPDKPYRAFIVLDDNYAVALMMPDGATYQALKSAFRALSEDEIKEYDASMAPQTVDLHGVSVTLYGRAVCTEADRYEIFTPDHTYCRVGYQQMDLSPLAAKDRPFSESAYGYLSELSEELAAAYQAKEYTLEAMGDDHLILSLQIVSEWIVDYPEVFVLVFFKDGAVMINGTMTPAVEQIILSAAPSSAAAQ